MRRMHIRGGVPRQAVSARPEPEQRHGNEEQRKRTECGGQCGTGRSAGHRRISRDESAASSHSIHERREAVSSKRRT